MAQDKGGECATDHQINGDVIKDPKIMFQGLKLISMIERRGYEHEENGDAIDDRTDEPQGVIIGDTVVNEV